MEIGMVKSGRVVANKLAVLEDVVDGYKVSARVEECYRCRRKREGGSGVFYIQRASVRTRSITHVKP